MKKPNALVQLLSELEAEDNGTSVVTVNASWAMITFPGEAEGIRLPPKDCELLFDSADTVSRLFEALEEPVDAMLELHSVSIEGEVRDALHEVFSSFDETT